MKAVRGLGHTDAMTPPRLQALVCIVWMASALLCVRSALATDRIEPEIVLYGFEPFGPFEVNPTGDLVAHLAQGHPERTGAVLPVAPADALGALYHLMGSRPQVILGFGVKADIKVLEVNTTATNWMAMRSEAAEPFFGAIEPGLPAAIQPQQSWVTQALSRLKASGVPHEVNPDAGLHACNLTFFQALVHAPLGTRVLFLHVPPDVLTRPGYVDTLKAVVATLVRP